MMPPDASRRVVHVIDGIGLGGAEFVLLYLVQGLQRHGYQNTIISLTSPRHLVAELEACGATVQSLDLAGWQLPVVGLQRLGQAVGKARPDIIQGWMYHGNTAASISRMLALRDCPVVWSIHNTVEPAPDYRWFTRLAMRGGALFSRVADAIVYVSAASAAQHERIGYAAARTAQIPNGIDIFRFRPKEGLRSCLFAKMGIDPSAMLLGCFARWDPMKGHKKLLRVLAGLRGSQVHLLLAGSGMDPQNSALLDMIVMAGLQGRVHLLGSRRDIPELMAALDLFVLPSIWGEAFPLVLGEAMATGLPCIATDVGDCRLMLGQAGLLVPPGDEAALAAAINQMLSLSQQERRAIGAQARERVMAHFSLPTMIERYRSLYEKLVHQRLGEPQWAA